MFNSVKNKWKIFLKTLSFCYFAFRWKIIGTGDMTRMLNMLQLYLSYECDYCSDKIIMNRDKYKSAALFSVLVKIYIEKGSDVTLAQLLSVLKEEFIKRDKDGRE